MMQNEWNQAREDRAFLLESLTRDGHTVLTLQANTPGEIKNHPTAFLLLAVFEPFLASFPLKIHRRIQDAMGHSIFYLVESTDAIAFKHDMMHLEETHPLGRLIDLDVYAAGQTRMLSRRVPRRCLLCEDAAFVCRRLGRHSTKELLAVIQQRISSYLFSELQNLILKAIYTELDLSPKFGLVTPTSQGSHTDMDYELMKRSAKAIAPYVAEMFLLPLSGDSEESLFHQARNLGLAAEAAMSSITGSVNTYKGLIFSLGLTSLAMGIVLCHGESFDTVFETITRLSKPLQQELGQDPISFGSAEYRRHGIGGARMEAILGFPSVQEALCIVESSQSNSALRALIQLIRTTEDTVLLKRAGSIERFQTVRSWFEHLDVDDSLAIEQLSARCIEEHLSFGGAADLLVVTYFLLYMRTYFHQR